MVAELHGIQSVADMEVSIMLVSQKNSGWVFHTITDGTPIGTREPSGRARISSGR